MQPRDPLEQITPPGTGGAPAPGTASGPGGTTPGGVYDTTHSRIFQQGNNVNDAWSTSPDWRMAAPQGGAAGAYGEMASGAMNPLEQAAGYGYGSVASGGQYGNTMSQLLNAAMGRTTAGNLGDQDPWLGNAMTYFGNQAQQASTPEASQLGGYLNMVNNPGYDAATKSAITNEGNNAITSQFSGLSDQLQNAAARTGSPLGAIAALSSASQNAGNQRAQLARQNQVLFANEAERQKEAGLSGLGANAGINLNRQLGFGNAAMQAQGSRFNQQTTAANQANQFISDALQRTLQGANGMSQLAQALQGKQAAGAAGLAGLDASKVAQQNQLYSILASILGTKQEDYTALAQTTGNIG